MAVESKKELPAEHEFRKKGFSAEGLIRAFFGGNAAVTVVILVLIITFLLREGIGFFPEYREESQFFRKSGMELVDIGRKRLTEHEQLVSTLNRAYFAEINEKVKVEARRANDATAYANYLSTAAKTPQDALMRISKGDGEKPAELMARLTGNYHELLKKAAAGEVAAKMPNTDSLSADEKARIVREVSAREILSTEDIPFVAELRKNLSVKTAKFAEPFKPLREAIDAYESKSEGLQDWVSSMGEKAKETRDAAALHATELHKKATLQKALEKLEPGQRADEMRKDMQSAITTPETDFAASIQPILESKDQLFGATEQLGTALSELQKQLPESFEGMKANRILGAAKKALPTFQQDLASVREKVTAWHWNEPIGIFTTIAGFVTGREWVTGGEWQDFYGMVPLFVGSLMIAIVALTLAIPLGVGAAIYTNQFASSRQQAMIKPTIEFLQAIPSVVLGFIGIAVLGSRLQEISMLPSASWMPGFPIEQRLNMFTAGCLLGLMAIPTIFSLSEDALNNVPSAYSEASDALGASKVQTVFRVMVPAAISGILAAVLLGLGRVIGETMVVLLVAGNRIAVPDFSEGIGSFFQPAHTLTGIIAQELGEVPFGSVHYRALFVTGAVLFCIVLGINWFAQRMMKRFSK